MLGHSPQQSHQADPAALIPWLRAAVLRPEKSAATKIQVRLRGNILHVLCESADAALPRDYVLMRLVRSLMEPEVRARLEAEYPQIYQIYVYSRKARDAKPLWSAPIYLNRLEKHLERLVQSASDAEAVAQLAQKAIVPQVVPKGELASDVTDGSADTGRGETAAVEVSVEQLSDISLARQGDSGAIARYLSESLSALNVGVKVSARVVPGKARRAKAVVAIQPLESVSEPIAPATDDLASESESDNNLETHQPESRLKTQRPESEVVSRLWVFCEASYSPDPLLIAEPIAERLRQLQLRQFQDAVITIQVTGEAASDWRLRVDLTPPEEMLKEWGRWGDVPALAMLVNHVSRRYGLKLVTECKKETLHLISYALSDVVQSVEAVGAGHNADIDGLVSDVGGMLKAIAPQGVHRAMIYGPSTDDISPEWLRGIDLPAAENSELAASAIALACEGDLQALAYCLTRALNPDIKDQLATGGIRVQLLLKDRLLHVMADGPVCPPKNAIVPLVNETLAPVNASDLAEGIRLYGRRAGQKQPIWTYGQDYQLRQRMVPEAKPEFAASEAYIGELITSVGSEGLAETSDEAGSDIKLTAVIKRALQYAMVKSQVFVPTNESTGLSSRLPTSLPAKTLPKAFQAESGKMALVWGALGLFLAIQFDFMVGQALRQAAAPEVVKTAQVPPDASGGDVSAGADGTQPPDGVTRVRPNIFDEELADLDWSANREDIEVWGEANTDDFGSGDFTASAINDGELVYSPQQEFVSTSSLLAGSTLPTFRSQQLDEKLALYRRRVAQSGPPDVLVIGSSRALRGVDPAALRQALGASGYDGLNIFNFGVNGATAQVVDLIVRRLIPPDQLPQMIVWADGARAFNSGRVDVTFNAIAASEGYRQLESSNTPDGMNDLALSSISEQLSARASAADRQMSELLGQISSGYTYRGKIRSALGQGFGAIAPTFSSATGTQSGDTPTGVPTETSLIDFDGFLALSTRFNPATYYQDHAVVKGAYDGDYKDFRLEGKQADATRNLLNFTADAGVPVIFINTPLTDEYLDNYRTRAEVSFRQHMVQLSERTGSMIFRDFGRLWPQRYDYFSDPSHLNRYGAYQVSGRLAQDPLISWPEPLPPPETE